MKHETTLYISNQATSRDSVIGALENIGCEVVSTNCSTQVTALLYIMHSVAAVVLYHRAGERTSGRGVQPTGDWPRRSDRPALPRPDRPLAVMRGCLRDDRSTARKAHLGSAEPADREGSPSAQRAQRTQ